MKHKIEIEGTFINGERYCNVADNKNDFLYDMEKIAKNECCCCPDTIRVKGNAPKYIKEYVARFEDSYSPINLVEI